MSKVGRPIGFRINVCRKGHDKSAVGRDKHGSCYLCRLEAQRVFAKNNPSIMKLRSYKAHAKERCLEFALTNEQFFTLIKKPCHYCGGFALALNGVDRVDNEKGYTEHNSVSCCKWCNRAKDTRSIEDFYAWVDRIQRRGNAP